MAVKRMTDLDLSGKRVLIREDLNVPLKNGEVSSDLRIVAALPTIKTALAAGAAVMLMSHLGRPSEGASAEENAEYSLAPVAKRLGELLGKAVPLVTDWLESPPSVAPGELVLCENVRFLSGEKADDEGLARRMASLCDVYVMDAFGTAHRAQASTHGVARFAALACAGPLLTRELDALERALADPARPMAAIVGGAKVSTKLELLSTLVDKVDLLIPGGGIANTFLAAAGYEVGKSLYEPELLETAKTLMSRTELPLPTDVVVAETLSDTATSRISPVGAVSANECIFDIGPESAETLTRLLNSAGTIVWNGPVGVFEVDQFAAGTKALAQAVADSRAYSLAGGGDTLAALEKFSVKDRISYVSTGGGAFMEYVEGKTLPAVAVLEA